MDTLRGPARDVLSLLIGGGLGALSVLALWPSLSTAAQAAPCASCAARGASLAAAEEEEEEGLEDSSVVPEEVELKMVLCVRADLNMSKGKVAAQCGHAVLACYRIARRVTPEYVKAWLFRAQAKITLKLDSEEQMDAIAAAARKAGIACCAIEDAGRTEVEPGTRTVLGLGPAPKAALDAITGPKGSHALRLLT